MKTILRRWGNSLALRIPKVFAMELGLVSGKEVTLSLGKNELHVTAQHNDLDILLASVKPENVHRETNTGSPTGDEIW